MYCRIKSAQYKTDATQQSMKKPIKVVLLCGFSDQSIQEYIKPFKREMEHALWISNLIKVFENKPDVELHVIAPHRYIPWAKRFTRNGIYYYFIHRGIPFFGGNWPGIIPIDTWFDYFCIKKTVRKLVDLISPDIIHLHGAENTYHTPAITQFHKQIPILVTIQGFVSKSSGKSLRVKRRQKRELYILKNFENFTYDSEITKNEILQFNKKANFFHHQYVRLFNVKPSNPTNAKEFDLVFFARLTKSKGIEDFLNLIAMLKQKLKTISAIVIGGCHDKYLKHLEELVARLGIQENVKFLGFLSTLEEVHQAAINAKVSVFPTYADAFSGTVAESMFLKLPLVVYETGGIPSVNDNGEVISLVPVGDVPKLADAAFELLTNDELRIERAEKAHQRYLDMFNNSETFSNLLSIYRSILR
jgi:glycosyltransferase involved in cell wall biosynthesis